MQLTVSAIDLLLMINKCYLNYLTQHFFFSPVSREVVGECDVRSVAVLPGRGVRLPLQALPA